MGMPLLGLSLLILLILFPAAAFADVGLPMLAVVWPLSAPAIIPVILVESWVVRRELGIGWRASLLQMVKANLLSTVAGIPLAWGILLILEFLVGYVLVGLFGLQSFPPRFAGEVGGVILSAPWLPPVGKDDYWIIPFATIVLLIPFFFASYWLEAWVVAHSLSPAAPQKARRAVWKANIASYAIISLACIAWLVSGLLPMH